jgi:hypothetical protein
MVNMISDEFALHLKAILQIRPDTLHGEPENKTTSKTVGPKMSYIVTDVAIISSQLWNCRCK